MMSDSTLSQEEINSLLSSSKAAGGNVVASDDKKIFDIKNLLLFVPSVIEKVIGGMVSGDFFVRLKDVKLGSKESFLLNLSDNQVLDVSTPFLSGIIGEHFFVSEQSGILALASGIIGQDVDSLEGAGLVSFSEIFNKIGERVCTELSQVLKLEIKVGNSDARLVEKELSRIPSGDLILIRYILNYKDKEIVLYEIMDWVLTQSLESVMVEQQKVVEKKVDFDSSRDLGTQKQQEKEGDIVLADTEVNSKSYATAPNVKGVQLPNLTQQGQGAASSSSLAGTQNIGLLMDVNMELTVELGRTRWQVKDILGMGEGTIIELDKLAGEPVDILVNRNLIARGEVVVIDENFGVRVTEIVSSIDRISDRRI